MTAAAAAVFLRRFPMSRFAPPHVPKWHGKRFFVTGIPMNPPLRGEEDEKMRKIAVHNSFILAAIRWKLSFWQPK
jgi:hypothetical protein